MDPPIVVKCANCPYTSKDRKICTKIQVEKPSLLRTKRETIKMMTVRVKNVIDSIFKLIRPTPSSPEEDMEEEEEEVGVCEICADILADLYNCHEAFAAPRVFESYISQRIRQNTLPSAAAAAAGASGPDSVSPILVTTDRADATTNTINDADNNEDEEEEDGWMDESVEKNMEDEKEEPNFVKSRKKLDKILKIQLVRLRPREIREATNRKKRKLFSSIYSNENDADDDHNNNNSVSKISSKRLKRKVAHPHPHRDEVMDNSERTNDVTIVFQKLKQTTMEQTNMLLDNYETMMQMTEPRPGPSGSSLDPRHHHDDFSTKEKTTTAVQNSTPKSIPNILHKPASGWQTPVTTLYTLRCPACHPASSKVYKTPKVFYLHLCTHLVHPDKKLKNSATRPTKYFCHCPVCSKKLTNSGIYSHLKLHANYKRFQCTVMGCTRLFNVRDSRDQHSKTVHGAKTVIPRRRTTYRPMKSGKKKIPQKLICHLCDRVCSRRHNLDRHIRLKHDDDPSCRRFACDLCHISFFNKSELSRHVESESHELLLDFERVKAGYPSMTLRDRSSSGTKNGVRGHQKNLENDEASTTSSSNSDAGNNSNSVSLEKLSGAVGKKENMVKSDNKKNKIKKLCPICHKRWTSLRQHFIMSHNMLSRKEVQRQQAKTCPTCKIIFNTVSRLQLHVQRTHAH